MSYQPRFMVCIECLRLLYGGSEKCCTHGWDLFENRPRGGICSECGEKTESLHCPDGPKVVAK